MSGIILHTPLWFAQGKVKNLFVVFPRACAKIMLGLLLNPRQPKSLSKMKVKRACDCTIRKRCTLRLI